MKRCLIVFLTFLLCFVFLVSCAEEEPPKMSIKDRVCGFLDETRYNFDTDGYIPLIAIVIEDHDGLCEIYDTLGVEGERRKESLVDFIVGGDGRECPEETYGEDYFENGYVIALVTTVLRTGDMYIAEGQKFGESISVEFQQAIESLTDAQGGLISLVPMEGKYEGETIVVSRKDLEPRDTYNPRTWEEYEERLG